MKAGTQHGDSDDILRVLAGFGVNHICSRLPSAQMDDAWSVESLTKRREHVESFGLTLDMVPLPLSSNEVSKSENPAIMLGRDPERDRQIDNICQMIRNTSRAGIPSVKYNLTFLGVPRTQPTVGRGRARYSTFVYANAKQEPPLTEAGPISADVYWERITYFLQKVVPVAAEHKVRLACHPQDPGMPPGRGWRGIETVLGTVEGLKRFVSIAENPYHGLNFCQGTVSEMLEKPGEQIYDVIRHFGKQGKIFNVHFRNIAGGFLNFRETFIDDGDVDMLKAMRVYKEIGYDGMMMPDHVPTIEGDTSNLQGFAFAFGYIKALIAAVDAE
jgi:mannonate dehydratase